MLAQTILRDIVFAAARRLPIGRLRAAIRTMVFAASRARLIRYGLGSAYAFVVRNNPAVRPHPVDAFYGVETSGLQPRFLLWSGRQADRDVTAYEAIQPSTLRRIMASVDIPERYAFVDIGCGKGRALILAAEARFKRVVGVEMSPDLCQVAERNARIVAAAWPDYSRIEVVNADATTWPLPAGNLLILLYNPFGAEAMVRFRSNLEVAHRAERCDILVAYGVPVHQDVLEGMTGFQNVFDEWVPVPSEERPFGQWDTLRVVLWRNTVSDPAAAVLH